MPFDVHAYDRHRPSYPAAALEKLTALGVLDRPRLVADVGSGTGLFTQALLERGHRVVGVEPVPELRELAEGRLAGVRGFASVVGSAEDTSLPDRCVDVATAASALHWFDLAAARAELLRVLREPGWVVALWNFRTTESSHFGAAFDSLWREALGPPPAAERSDIEEVLMPEFFWGMAFERYSFANALRCTEDQLVGLAASSSNAPPRDSAEWRGMEARMRQVHRDHQCDEVVEVPYETVMFCGRLL